MAPGVLSEYTAAVATRLGLLAPKVILLGGLFQRDRSTSMPSSGS